MLPAAPLTNAKSKTAFFPPPAVGGALPSPRLTFVCCSPNKHPWLEQDPPPLSPPFLQSHPEQSRRRAWPLPKPANPIAEKDRFPQTRVSPMYDSTSCVLPISVHGWQPSAAFWPVVCSVGWSLQARPTTRYDPQVCHEPPCFDLVLSFLHAWQLLQGLSEDAQRLVQLCFRDDQRRSKSDDVAMCWFRLFRVSLHLLCWPIWSLAVSEARG